MPNIGDAIRALRLERGMTQKELGEKINISDKAVSKWERGMGCPDISIIPELSNVLGADIQRLLSGDMTPNDFVGGNMKNAAYYTCPACGNITVCTGKARVSCCGKKLAAEQPKAPFEGEDVSVLSSDGDWYITSRHPMQKDHYISFVAIATDERIQIVKQYPEWGLELRLPERGKALLIWFCTKHGLFCKQLTPPCSK